MEISCTYEYVDEHQAHEIKTICLTCPLSSLQNPFVWYICVPFPGLFNFGVMHVVEYNHIHGWLTT